MPIPATLVPALLTALSALVRFRDRVDDLLALNKTAEGLPFALPPAPVNVTDHREAMLQFLGSPTGQVLIHLQGLEDDWTRLVHDFGAEAHFSSRQRLFRLYCQAAELPVPVVGPEQPGVTRVAQGPTPALRLAWFVVESHRLSRNPALSRVLLAAADTLLEFGAQHAMQLVHDPRLRPVLETSLTEFAVKRDWDDAAPEGIFRAWLGAVASAVARHGPNFTHRPALGTLCGALSDLQTELGDEFVERLVSRSGFVALAQYFLRRSADADPGSDLGSPVRQVMVALLRELGDSAPEILGDPETLVKLAEAALDTVASPDKADAVGVLRATLQALAAHGMTGIAGAAHPARKGLVSALYHVALTLAASYDPATSSNTTFAPRIDRLVTAVMGVLEDSHLNAVLGRHALEPIGEQVVRVMRSNPAVWGRLIQQQVAGPLLRSLLAGLARGPARMLPEATFARLSASCAARVGRYGVAVVEKRIRVEWLESVLGSTLEQAEQLLGDGLDLETLPHWLEEALEHYLRTPFDPDHRSASARFRRRAARMTRPIPS